MKTLLLFICFPFIVFSQSLKIDPVILDSIRVQFYQAVEDEDKMYELENFIRNNFSTKGKKNLAIVLSYIGGVETLKGKHAFNPFSKLGYLSDGLDTLQTAIDMEPDNLEIRFMRFSILHHLPGILGYGEERKEDLNKIYHLLLQKNYSSVNQEIQKGIVEFMIASERLNDKQIQQLELIALSLANNE